MNIPGTALWTELNGGAPCAKRQNKSSSYYVSFLPKTKLGTKCPSMTSNRMKVQPTHLVEECLVTHPYAANPHQHRSCAYTLDSDFPYPPPALRVPQEHEASSSLYCEMGDCEIVNITKIVRSAPTRFSAPTFANFMRV